MPERSFYFDSGESVTLTDEQIQGIPYIEAMVRNENHFFNNRDQNGNLKIDSNITYQSFVSILSLLPIKSFYSILKNLNREVNIVPIVFIIDYLGLLNGQTPHLNDVDWVFFGKHCYDVLPHKFELEFNTISKEEMAARFIIGLIKEEYDLNVEGVIDQIHWYLMFILNAKDMFHENLRCHAYQAAQHYAEILKPNRLEKIPVLRKPVSRSKPVVIPPGRKKIHRSVSSQHILFEKDFFIRKIRERYMRKKRTRRYRSIFGSNFFLRETSPLSVWDILLRGLRFEIGSMNLLETSIYRPLKGRMIKIVYREVLQQILQTINENALPWIQNKIDEADYKSDYFSPRCESIHFVEFDEHRLEHLASKFIDRYDLKKTCTEPVWRNDIFSLIFNELQEMLPHLIWKKNYLMEILSDESTVEVNHRYRPIFFETSSMLTISELQEQIDEYEALIEKLHEQPSALVTKLQNMIEDELLKSLNQQVKTSLQVQFEIAKILIEEKALQKQRKKVASCRKCFPKRPFSYQLKPLPKRQPKFQRRY